MKQLKEDFEFLLQVSQEFFLCEDIISKLKLFEQEDINGWEIWLQVEFALFLKRHEKVSEVERERKFNMDLRKSKDKGTCSIDFFIRQKHKQSSIPLEVKQAKEAATCIRHMIKDISKFDKIRSANFATGHSLWCLGVHRKVNEDHLNNLIHENKSRVFDKAYVKSIEIPGTSYMFTLI